MPTTDTADPVGSRPVTVERDIPVTYDIGNLAIFDPNILSLPSNGDDSAKELLLKSLARDSAQLLINQILALPVVAAGGARSTATAAADAGVYVQLPDPVTHLPREKPVPVPKPPTKWEKFAKQKGITPKARNTGNLTYDEGTGEWVKKWGYKGKNQEQPWIVEVDDSGAVVDDDSGKKTKKPRTKK
ncbi:Rrs1 ribosome biogenesis and nuclear export protein [Limtongia smithiae]|uniref:Rrs1 ribosome biogenesis and nuclear export protein n=1 Tax=Limtongia smithiae TaxID=1125753 RepID=UPI0034CEC55D